MENNQKTKVMTMSNRDYSKLPRRVWEFQSDQPSTLSKHTDANSTPDANDDPRKQTDPAKFRRSRTKKNYYVPPSHDSKETEWTVSHGKTWEGKTPPWCRDKT